MIKIPGKNGGKQKKKSKMKNQNNKIEMNANYMNKN